MTSLPQDVRYALRSLRKSPGFLVVAVLSLGLGVGANTALFSVFNSLFLRPVTASNPEQLAGMWVGADNGCSYPNYVDLRDSHIFAGLAGDRFAALNLRSGDQIERVSALIVTGNFFQMLGVNAALGRTFTADEAKPEREPRVVIASHGFWQRRLRGDPDAVGATLNLSGHPFTLVGVLPQGYRSVEGFGLAPELYLPAGSFLIPDLNNRQNSSLHLVGRLEPGHNAKQTQTALTAFVQGLALTYPKEDSGFKRSHSLVYRLSGLRGILASGDEQEVAFVVFFGILLVVVGLVLLIACANVAGLLLARGVSRRREIAIRLALGAGRGQLLRQLLLESSLVTLASLGAAVLVNLWIVPLIRSIPVPGSEPLELQLTPDLRVLAYSLVLAIVTTMMCGMAPAFESTRLNLVPALKLGIGRPGHRRFSLRHALVAGQVAVSAMLLIASLLFLRSLIHVNRVDPGFDTDHTLAAELDLEKNRYPKQKAAQFIEQAIERVEQMPEVESASMAAIVPMSGDSFGTAYETEDRPGVRGPESRYNDVGPRYFHTMGIPVVRGREFQRSDQLPGAAHVAIVNETFARRYFPASDPLGKRIRSGDQTYLEIIGIVRDSKYSTPGEETWPVLYHPFVDQEPAGTFLQVRMRGPAPAGVNPVRQALAELDRDMRIDVKTMRESMAFAYVPNRIASLALGAMGVLGLLLAMIGLYGVMAYAVSRRTAEIGIRMALGASRPTVVTMVLRDALIVIAIGVVAGVGMALVLTRPLAGFLAAGMSATDPVIFAGVALLLALVGLSASYVPARRAAKVDPMIALRYE